MFYEKPITSLEEAKAYLQALCEASMAYHLEDDALEIFGAIGYPLNARRKELYDLDWAEFDCPIGYMLTITGD